MRERITLPYFAEQDGTIVFAVKQAGAARVVGYKPGDCFVVDPQTGEVHHNREVVCTIDQVSGIAVMDAPLKKRSDLDEMIALARGEEPAPAPAPKTGPISTATALYIDDAPASGTNIVITKQKDLPPSDTIVTLALSDLLHRYTTAVRCWGGDPADVADDMRAAWDLFFGMSHDTRVAGTRVR